MALVLVAVACGGPRPTTSGGSAVGTPPAGLATFPVARLVPAQSAYVLMSARAEFAVFVIRELLDTFGVLAPSITADRVDAELRQELGVSLISVSDLTEIGVDLGRSAALFGTPPELTLAVPVRDAALLDAALRKVFAGWEPGSVEIHGVTATQLTRRSSSVIWLEVDGWLVLHVSTRNLEDAPSAGAWLGPWLDARERGETFATSADFDWAWQAGGERHDVLGVVDTKRFAAGFPPDDEDDCVDKDRLLSLAVPRFGVAATIGKDAIDARLTLPIGDLAAAWLRAHVSPPPPAWQAARARAAAYASFALDLDAAAELAKGVRDRGCVWTGLVAELDLDDMGAPVPGLGALHLAVVGAAAGQGGLELGLAIAGVLVDRAVFDGVLRELPPLAPGREGDVETLRYTIPGLAWPLEVAVTPAGVRAAAGPGQLAPLLAGGVAAVVTADAPVELVVAAVQPPALAAALAELATRGREGQMFVRLLERFTLAEARLALVPGALQLDGKVTLARRTK